MQDREPPISENGYAQSQGMTLLSHVIEQVGPLFTSAEAHAAAPELAPQRVNAVLSQLAQAGWIERLKRGTYAVTTSIFEATIHPYAVATFLVSPVAISHWSALNHHGFTTQIPPMIQASTPSTVVTPEMRRGEAYRPRGRSVWRALGFEFEFVQVQAHHFFGFDETWISRWHRVAVTDPERTLLDLFAAPHVFGSLQVGLETLEAELKRLDAAKLVGYALRYDVGAVIKRLGWAMESLGVPDSVTAPLLAYPIQSYSQLDPTAPPNGTPIARWQLRHNLQPETNHADD